MLNIVERQLLWVLEMYAFAEAVRCSRLQQMELEASSDSVGSGVDSAASGRGRAGAVGSDKRVMEHANHPPPLKCWERARKVRLTEPLALAIDHMYLA